MTATEVPLPRAAASGTVTGTMSRPAVPTTLLAAVAALLLAAGPADARRGGDGRDVRTAASCSGSAAGKLKLSTEDGGIEAEFELEHAHRGSTWRITVVQEGRVVRRTTARASSLGRFARRFVLRDLAGADRVGVRAQATDGSSCRAAATLAGA